MALYSSSKILFYIGSGLDSLSLVGYVNKLSPTGLRLNAENWTSNASTGGYVEIMPTTVSTGGIDVGLYYDPANSIHANMMTYLLNKTHVYVKIVFPTTPVKNWIFSGYVLEFKPVMKLEDPLELEVKFVFDGVPTFS